MRLCVTSISVCLSLASPAVAFAPKQEGSRDLLRRDPAGVEVRAESVAAAEPSGAGDAVRSFVRRHGGQWTFSIDRRTERFSLIQGSGIPLIPGSGNDLGPETLVELQPPDGEITLGALQPRVRAFIEANADLLLPTRGELVLDPVSSMIRDRGRLISFNFEWRVDGIPVEGARVFVRINSGNITQAGAPLVGPIDIETRPSLGAGQAEALLLAYSGDAEAARLVGDAQLVIVPVDGGGGLDHRLQWKIVYRIQGRIETWEGRVDAHSGEVVAFRDVNWYARAVGGVYPRTVFNADETPAPMPLLAVTVGGLSVTTDTAGSYAYEGGALSSGLNGTFFDTNCDTCTNPPQPSVQIDGIGTGRIDFGEGGDDEIGNGRSSAADRNSFFHLNQVRRIARKWLPGLGFLNQTGFTSNVNIQSTCNAVYTGDAVNFYRSGAGCNNTGEIADVVYHEYGHGIDLNSNGGDGATGEATADVVSVQQTHSPLIGPGFNVSGAPVRNLDKATSSKGLLTTGNLLSKCSCGPNQSCGPLGGEVHCEGEIYGQTHWDLSQGFVAKHGHHTGWRALERIFYLSLPDASGYLPSDPQPVYDAYINADDDNGNLADGTPNGQQIFDAFNLHGMANASVPSSIGCARPAQPELDVVAQCDRFDLSWSAVPDVDHYEVFRTELLPDQAFFPVATVPATETGYTDTEVAPGVSYWYVVMAVRPNGCESKVENPVPATLPSQPILTLIAAADDDEPMGNRSGFPDPAEEVDLHLTLANVGDGAAVDSSGSLTSTTPGVTILLGVSDFGDLEPGATTDNSQALRFVTDDAELGCGDALRFRLAPEVALGCSAETSFFEVRLGQRIVEHHDDFEADLGWQFDAGGSTASTGAWTRGDPQATSYQPGDDVTENGTQCWFTAPNPGGGNGVDDVDNGVVVLLSPIFDLSGLAQAEVSYHRWFAMSEAGTDPGDFFKAEVSDDGGGSWVELETLAFDAPAPAWTRRAFALEDLIALTSQVRFRFQASDGVADGSVVEAAIDEFSIDRYACDDTPACFIDPTFAGLETLSPGASCGEVDLAWQPAISNCLNAEITYNVYRSTSPGFLPGPGNLAFGGLTSLALTDTLLEPDQTYHYVVRAFDSRSGEDGNLVELSAVAPATPDSSPPVFGGVESVTSGDFCGETVLGWVAALESCNTPVAYDVHRSTDPGFAPGPGNRVATTYATSFADAGLAPGVAYTYLVRARDDAGNGETNDIRLTAGATVLDFLVAATSFEPNNGGWSVGLPNDASAGKWQWGNPVGTPYQPEDDATPGGINCWMTGLTAVPSNGDVDGGTTTLLSALYDMSGGVNPVVRFAQWFTNDQGGGPGEATDSFKIDVSNNSGFNWTPLATVGAGTPLAWVPVSHAIPLPATASMRFRFTAADLGAGSLVEAGIDDFELVNAGQGCSMGCGSNPPSVCTLTVSRSGEDIVLDWGGDPGQRVLVYHIGGCGQKLLLGTVEGGSVFVHEDAALSTDSFNYRVTSVDSCGAEVPFCGPTDCP